MFNLDLFNTQPDAHLYPVLEMKDDAIKQGYEMSWWRLLGSRTSILKLRRDYYAY